MIKNSPVEKQFPKVAVILVSEAIQALLIVLPQEVLENRVILR